MVRDSFNIIACHLCNVNTIFDWFILIYQLKRKPADVSSAYTRKSVWSLRKCPVKPLVNFILNFRS